MADPLVETAIANWEPRFVANGVDGADFARITAAIARWDDWCGAWSAAADGYAQLATSSRAAGHARSAGEFDARAALYYHFGRFLFVHDRDQERAAHQRAVAALTRALPELAPPGRRELVAFEGGHLVALVRTPAGSGPHPVVILIPGLDSTKEEFGEVERAFLDRGLATASLDGPGQGEAEGEWPIRPDWAPVGEAVLAHLATRPDLDVSRVGVWGVSLGGYYAARLAAADLGLRAVVALSGPYDFGASYDDLNPLTQRAFAVRARAASSAAARQRASDLTMVGHAERITVPLLVIQGQQDRLFSWHEGERLVAEARGEATLWAFPEGNHGCANVVTRHRGPAADWLADRLGPPASEGGDQ